MGTAGGLGLEDLAAGAAFFWSFLGAAAEGMAVVTATVNG
jgi:hypothetical protein